MSEECTDCETGIEPGAVAPDSSTVTETEQIPRKPIPEEEKAKGKAEVQEAEVEKIPEKAEVSGMLGLLTSACLLTDEDKREECWKGIEPLEESKEQPLETVKRIIGIEGVENVKKTMSALQNLIEEAEKTLLNKP